MRKVVITCDYCGSDITDWSDTHPHAMRFAVIHEERRADPKPGRVAHFCDMKCLKARVEERSIGVDEA